MDTDCKQTLRTMYRRALLVVKAAFKRFVYCKTVSANQGTVNPDSTKGSQSSHSVTRNESYQFTTDHDTDEIIVFLILKTGWTLEYTTNLVKTLPLKKLNKLVQEIQFQQSIEDYKTASNFAMLLANWASAQGKRKYKITDFIGQAPRKSRENTLVEAAEKEGIIIPKE